MFVSEMLAVPTEALTTVGLVLAEALALYVVYGALDAALAPKLLAAIEGN
jgi:hypothetical protein